MIDNNDLKIWVRSGEPCSHKSCLNHVKTRCEGCNRKGGNGTIYIVDDVWGEFKFWEFDDLSDYIKNKSVEFLKDNIDEETKEQIVKMYEKESEAFLSFDHWGFGMAIRNGLRENVCLDDDTPSGNWDDYYIELVKMACGIKS